MAWTLYIGNKNYSSWSLRPWLLMRHLGLPFTEVALRFDFTDGSDFRRTVAAVSPAGRVPVLVDDTGFAVWDSLAIVEALADAHPGAGVWPAERRARARARSVCAEMHSGFGALRSACPMNLEAHLPEVGARLLAEQPALHADLARLSGLWSDALAASGGPFLFGEFSAADAFYAPVATRLRTYGLPCPADGAAWMAHVLALPAFRAWEDAARAEHHFVPEDEPYRSAPAG